MSWFFMVAYFIFSWFILYNMNAMTYKLIIQKEIPEVKQPGVFRMINVCITILLISLYVKVVFT
ncbi:hypothetical protein [Bacillus testis]|uniref:hypothetical protein n=1 Tax=Bacillus testis TaxID=1622072 RepID=UPI00067E6771|nr:hypothetical protein [Bacillus testis]